MQDLAKNVVIVGGGLAGLAASVYLARAGRSVTLFERRPRLGGRAATQIRQGFRFNLGPHAVYRGGASFRVYRELGVPVRGGTPPQTGVALYRGSRYRLPATVWSILMTRLFTRGAKWEALRILRRVARSDSAEFADLTAQQWLDETIRDDRLREVVGAFMRLATYSGELDRMSASAAIAQLKVGRRGVVYVDEGWQKLVDTLHSHAVAAGVNFVTSSRVVRVDHAGAVNGIEIGGLVDESEEESAPPAERGTWIPASVVLLAVDPAMAHHLIGEAQIWGECQPVRIASLDVALSTLPHSKPLFALGIDTPAYVSVHSAWAHLTPKGGALIHVAKYGPAGESELESLLDDLQPGWRERVVHRRFLPNVTVSNALPLPGMLRPAPRTPVSGLYLAGDWVGSEGLLSDAALASARTAAKMILSDTDSRW